ncbi:MAG TPA: DUF4349 domain-containing protein [Candidatus Limnocylindrales bacterium]|jgi:hypothetical protein|nr:DUF4349 domain-containing protein [Candidatus Limnocylindrales bacterium]
MLRPFGLSRWSAGLVVAVALLLAGCAGSSQTTLSTVGDSIGSGGAPAASSRPAPIAASGDTAAFRDDAKIIRNGSLSLRVEDLDAAVRAGRDAIRAIGGYVGASRQANNGDNSVASIAYRIPAARWDDALDTLRQLGTVLSEETDAVEVTGQIVDLEARIRNLRASETALQKIAAGATKVTDVLEVERRLTEVRGQIEQLDAQRADLEDRAGYGTLTVTYGIQVVAVTEAAKGWDPATEVDRATGSLIEILQALTTAGIWFAIVWVPILLTIGLVAAAVVFVLRRLGVMRRPDSSEAPLPG